jgi:hypothetical protein
MIINLVKKVKRHLKTENQREIQDADIIKYRYNIIYHK